MQTSLKPLSSLRLLSALLWTLGLGATFGGAVLVLDPSGTVLGMPLSILQYSPFNNFLIPGLILGIVFGLGSFATLWAVWQRPAWPLGSALTRFTGEHWSWSAVVALGLGQVIWIVTQMLMLRGVSWLHFVFGGLGMAIGWVALEPHFKAYLALKPPLVSRQPEQSRRLWEKE